MSFVGAFEGEELHVMSDVVRRSEEALLARGVQVDDGPSGLEQRDLLSRIVLDIFSEGPREAGEAIQESVRRYLVMRPGSDQASAA